MALPTSLSTFTNVTATELLENAVTAKDHDQQHANLNTAIIAAEARIGKNVSPAVDSMEWQLQNGIYRPTDFPAASPNAMDDEFSASSLDAKWTMINSGISVTEVLTLSGSWLKFNMPATTSVERNRFIVQTIPSYTGTWKFGMKYVLHWDCNESTSNMHSGIWLRNSSTQKYCSWGFNRRGSKTDSKASAWNWSSTDTFVSGALGATDVPWAIIYVGVERTATNYNFLWSEDGVTWAPLYTIATSGHHVGDADQVGIGLMAGSTISALQMNIDWFRKIA